MSEKEKIKEKAVKIFLMNKEKKFLMQLRDKKKGIYHPGFWGLLGGGVDGNESLLEAIKREIREEISCDAKNVRQIGEVKSLGRKKNIDVVMFKGEIDYPAEQIKLNEGQKVGFFSLKEILNLKTPEFVKKFIKENNILRT